MAPQPLKITRPPDRPPDRPGKSVVGPDPPVRWLRDVKEEDLAAGLGLEFPDRDVPRCDVDLKGSAAMQSRIGVDIIPALVEEYVAAMSPPGVMTMLFLWERKPGDRPVIVSGKNRFAAAECLDLPLIRAYVFPPGSRADAVDIFARRANARNGDAGSVADRCRLALDEHRRYETPLDVLARSYRLNRDTLHDQFKAQVVYDKLVKVDPSLDKLTAKKLLKLDQLGRFDEAAQLEAARLAAHFSLTDDEVAEVVDEVKGISAEAARAERLCQLWAEREEARKGHAGADGGQPRPNNREANTARPGRQFLGKLQAAERGPDIGLSPGSEIDNLILGIMEERQRLLCE